MNRIPEIIRNIVGSIAILVAFISFIIAFYLMGEGVKPWILIMTYIIALSFGAIGIIFVPKAKTN